MGERAKRIPLATLACAFLGVLSGCQTTAEEAPAFGVDKLAPEATASLLCDGHCDSVRSLERKETVGGDALWGRESLTLPPGGYRLTVLWKPKGFFGGEPFVTELGNFWIEAGERFAVKRCDYQDRSDKDSSLFLSYRVFWIEDADSGEVILDWPGRGSTEGCRG